MFCNREVIEEWDKTSSSGFSKPVDCKIRSMRLSSRRSSGVWRGRGKQRTIIIERDIGGRLHRVLGVCRHVEE